jgi:hypothetical protein
MDDTIKVPITFEKVDDDLTCVKWTTWLNKTTSICQARETERFQLNYAPLDVCYFNVSCVYNFLVKDDGSRRYCFEIFLTQVKSFKMDNVNVNDTSPVSLLGPLDSHRRRPYAVWSTINGNAITLKEVGLRHGFWKSTKTYVSIANLQPPLFSCFLWIKFKMFGIGEISALNHMADLLARQTHSDVQFCFGNGEKIGGHVAILSARSPVFAAMFQHDMQESKTRKVVIEDIVPEIFKELLHYIYSGRCSTPLTEGTAQPLFVAADKYDIKDLKEDCVQYLLPCVTVKNAVELLIWADLQSIDKLKKAALDCVISNGKEICHQEEWEKLMKSYPDLCLTVTRRMVDIAKFPSSKRSRTEKVPG